MAPFLAALESQLDASRVLSAPEDLIPYSFDGTAALRQRPRAVVFPRTTADVAALLHLAREHRVPVVTRGSGTGLSGGSVPVAGALVLCLVQLDRILELDTRNLTLRADHLHATGARIVATANPGCHVQIANGLRARGDTATEVVHPIILLARAYAAERQPR